ADQLVFLLRITGLAGALQIELYGGNELAQLVVQIARQAAAVVLLGGNELRRKLAQAIRGVGGLGVLMPPQGTGVRQIPRQHQDDKQNHSSEQEQRVQQARCSAVEHVRRNN